MLSTPSARGLWWPAGLVTAAAALWCTRGVLDVVAGPSGEVTRIALLPSGWLLAGFVLVLGAFAVVATRKSIDPDVALPLCALGLLAVPYLPFLPDRLPVLRAAAGPARLLVWAVVFWLIACRDPLAFRSRVSTRLSRAFAHRASAPLEASRFALWRRGPLVIFVASALVFGVVARRMIDTPMFPGGDEPHYLVITQSLLHDRDFEIENNHRGEEYRSYFKGSLKPDYLALGKDGRIYSIHPVGLPVVAMPAFALGGYHGVVAMLVVMAALAAALMWRWAREITNSADAATFAWAATALTAPFLFNSFTVYPEIPAALAVLAAIGWRTESMSAGMMTFRGLAIGALPWLSTKYAPMAVAAAIVVALRAGPNRRALAALLAPMALALVAWFAFFWWIWGTPSPSAPYGSSEPTTWRYLIHGAPGLIFDQEYGIVATAPVFAIALVGLIQMIRAGGTPARRAAELTFIFGALLCTVGAFHIWWGGEASAGRPVASGMLLLGIPIANVFASSKTETSARVGCHILLGFSLALAALLVAVQHGALVHQDRDGSAVLLDWASPTSPLAPAFPSFLVGSVTGALWRTAAWLVLGAMVAWVVRRFGPHSFGGAALAAMGLAIVLGVAFVSSVTAPASVPPDMAPEIRARVPLLDRFDSQQLPTAIVYDPLSRRRTADALSHVTLIARPGLRTAPQPIELLWNARFALPAGAYRVRLTRPGGGSDGKLSLQVGRTGSPIETWDVSGPIWEHRFVLPISAELVGFRADASLANSDGEVQITPIAIVNAGQRVPTPPVIAAKRYGAATAYFHDDMVFAESTGYWTRGRARTKITYAADGDSTSAIDITMHCGPTANRVTLSTDAWRERLTIEPGVARRVAIPARDLSGIGVHVAALEIAVEGGFIPADVDRASSDRRFLGCRIEPR